MLSYGSGAADVCGGCALRDALSEPKVTLIRPEDTATFPCGQRLQHLKGGREVVQLTIFVMSHRAY